METIQLQLNIDEVNGILEALGQMPYAKVHQLIGKIHQQASGQFQEAEREEPRSRDLETAATPV